MPKGKSRKKKKAKLNYRVLLIGFLFHYPMYLWYPITDYPDGLFWGSLLCCGLIFGGYIIGKLGLHRKQAYHKVTGIKLEVLRFGICLLMFFGATLIFGNVINGTLVGLNYAGLSSEVIQDETHTIEKIKRQRRLRIKRQRRLRRSWNYYPVVYYREQGKIQTFWLPEPYHAQRDYSQYQTLELQSNKGWLGFDVIVKYSIR